MLERALQWAQLTIQKKDAEIQLLQERLRKQRIGFLGPSSETLSDFQLELLAEQEPGVTREEVEAESRREPISTAPPRERKQKAPGLRRGLFLTQLGQLAYRAAAVTAAASLLTLRLAPPLAPAAWLPRTSPEETSLTQSEPLPL